MRFVRSMKLVMEESSKSSLRHAFLQKKRKLKCVRSLQMQEQNLSKLLPDFLQREQLLQM